MANLTAEILKVQRDGDVTTTVLRLSEDFSWDPALAPATLWSSETPKTKVLELHQVTVRDGATVTCESYGATEPLPTVGETYRFASWWLNRGALDLIKDTSLTWERAAYPENGDSCLSCPLTYKRLRDVGEGYRSGSTWVTVEGYERFIRDDRLRVRQPAGRKS